MVAGQSPALSPKSCVHSYPPVQKTSISTDCRSFFSVVKARETSSVITSDVNKEWTHKDQDKDKDQSHKDKDKDLTYKDSKRKRRQAQHSFF